MKILINIELNCDAPKSPFRPQQLESPPCCACLTYEKVRGQRRHHKASERLLLLVPDVAEPRQVVSVHQPHDEDDDGLDGGDGPGGDVEVGAVHLDGLVAPFQPSGQEPGEGQDHPPGNREGA